MVRILYFIASHKNPGQILRLVETLKSGSPESLVLIHHDCSKSFLDSDVFKHMSGVYVMKETLAVEWGDSSMIDMVFHCFEWLRSRSIEFDWIVFLSGQDYPIRPLRELEAFLKNTRYDGFMGYGEAKDVSFWGDSLGEDRYYFSYYKLPHFLYYYKLPSILKKLLSMLRTLINKIQPLIRIKPFPRGLKTRLGVRKISTPFTSKFKCYRGPSWCTLSYKCVKYILQSVRENPYTLKYYQRTIIPEESVFHTIVLNNHALNIANKNLHYISWASPSSAHPDILISEAFDRIITSKQFFARKFDIKVDSHLMDMIDEHVLKLI
jgi:hypothetical protein